MIPGKTKGTGNSNGIPHGKSNGGEKPDFFSEENFELRKLISGIQHFPFLSGKIASRHVQLINGPLNNLFPSYFSFSAKL